MKYAAISLFLTCGLVLGAALAETPTGSASTTPAAAVAPSAPAGGAAPATTQPATTKPAAAMQERPLPPIAPEKGSFWLPVAASTQAKGIDAIWDFILYVSLFFLALITVLTIWFPIRYRRRYEGQPAESQVSHNTTLELTWTIIPLILVVFMFWGGFRGYIDLTTPPADAYEIGVIGQKWNWTFAYAGTTLEPGTHYGAELHTWKNQPTRLLIQSQDVLHSFYVPAFRIKRDAVPGRYTKIWFTPTKAGEFLALCTEFCGTSHSDMLSRVVVHETKADFEAWLKSDRDPWSKGASDEQVGEQIWKQRCKVCHSIDGSANTGPSWGGKDGIFGRQTLMADGQSVPSDENYLKESILYPNNKKVKGYEAVVMPTFKGQLSDRQIDAIIKFMKTIKPK